MLNDNEKNNGMLKSKDINEMDISSKLIMNDSLLLDDKKTLNLVK